MVSSLLKTLLFMLVSLGYCNATENLLIGLDNNVIIVYDVENNSYYDLVRIPQLGNPNFVLLGCGIEYQLKVVVYDQNLWLTNNERIDYEYNIDLKEMKVIKSDRVKTYFSDGNYYTVSNLESDSAYKREISKEEFVLRTIDNHPSTFYLDKGRVMVTGTRDTLIDKHIQKKKICGILFFSESYNKEYLVGEYACWRYSEKNVVTPIEIILIEIDSKSIVYTGVFGCNPKLSKKNRYILYQTEGCYLVYDLLKKENIDLKGKFEKLNWLW